MKIFIQIRFNLKHWITKKKILYIFKKNVNHLNILKKSITKQEINLKNNLINNFIKKLSNILSILKKQN